jgi:hypothetical protein
VAECTSKQVSKHPNAKYQDMGIAYMVIVLLIGIGGGASHSVMPHEWSGGLDGPLGDEVDRM